VRGRGSRAWPLAESLQSQDEVTAWASAMRAATAPQGGSVDAVGWLAGQPNRGILLDIQEGAAGEASSANVLG
jgi:hypothetical protein